MLINYCILNIYRRIQGYIFRHNCTASSTSSSILCWQMVLCLSFSFVSCCVSDRFVIIPLHSLMPTVNQTQVSILLFLSLSVSPTLCLSVSADCTALFLFQYQKSPISSFPLTFLRCSKGLLLELERL